VHGTWPARRCGPSSASRAKRLPGVAPSAQTLGRSGGTLAQFDRFFSCASMIQPLGVAWVGLHAENLPALADFYAKTVGFLVVECSDHMCMLDAGRGTLLELWGEGASSPSGKTSRQQPLLVGFLVERLESVVEELRGRGLEPDTPIDSYAGTRWIYYTDPEGNRFEFKDLHG